MLSGYKERKKDVLSSYGVFEENVEELQDYARKNKLPDPTELGEKLLTSIRGQAKRVEWDKFTIMVAGESKSGKSTFINAYLGVELLPMDVKQCTSAIVKIHYGEELSIRATYADGVKERIMGEEKVRDFLKKNAALDDAYRSIPVPTINYEILVKAGQGARAKGRKISISSEEKIGRAHV